MVRRFKSRATAGRLFLTGVMSQFTDAGDITSDAYRGDGDAGTFAVPSEPNVRDGTQYGADGTEYEGTYEGGVPVGDIVAPQYVIVGQDNYVGGEAGTFAVPAESDVRDGTGYGADGTEFEGTLSVPDYSSITAEAGRVQQMCEALVALLDAGDLAGAFYETIGATRTYTTLSDLSEVRDSVVAVVAPQMTKRARNSNGTYGRYVVIDILVRIHLTSDATADRTTMDNRAYLLEQIDNYLAAEANCDLTLADGATAEYVEPTDSRADSDMHEGGRMMDGLGVLWDIDDLLDKRQVTGLVRVAYWVDEDY